MSNKLEKEVLKLSLHFSYNLLLSAMRNCVCRMTAARKCLHSMYKDVLPSIYAAIL